MALVVIRVWSKNILQLAINQYIKKCGFVVLYHNIEKSVPQTPHILADFMGKMPCLEELNTI